MAFVDLRINVILLLGIVSTIFLWSEHNREYMAPYEPYVDEVICEFGKVMQKEFDLHMYGDGGIMPYDVEELCVDFRYGKPVTVEQARFLEVHAAETFLSIINAHEKLRSYLREYPFPPSRLNIYITFRTRGGSFFEKSLANAFLVNGKICYKTYDILTEMYVKKFEEPYSEALEIINQKGDGDFNVMR